MTPRRLVAGYVLLLAVLIVGVHYWALSHVPPIQDASNLVARSASRALELERLRLRDLAAHLRLESNNLLSTLYFSFFSLLLGPGRIAWGWGWAALATGWFLAARAAEARHPGEQPLLASVLFFSLAPLVFRPGGLLDQRFDPMAVLVASAAAFALVAQRPLAAAWLSLVAVLAKGVALPVLAVTWLAALATGVTRIGDLARDARARPWAWAALGIGLVAYGWFFLRDVVAYNLSAVLAPTPGGRSAGFFLEAPSQAWAARWFYPRALLRHARFAWLLVAGGAAAFVLAALRKDAPRRRRAAFGLVLFVLLDLLFAATPPAAAVLVVWLSPALLVLSLAVLPPPRHRPWLLVVGGALALTAQVYLHTVGRAGLGAEAAAALPALHAQAGALAGALEARNLRNGRVVVLTNVLYSPAPDLAYNAHTYRVLIYERLGRDAPILDGWTLGSWSDGWRAEIAPFPADSSFLTLLAVGARDDVHHRGRAQAIAAEFLAEVDPACELAMPEGFGRSELGRPRVFLTAADLKTCR